jgi:deoxyhypusine synthase
VFISIFYCCTCSTMTTFSDWKDTAGEELARSSVLAKSTEIFPSANFVRGYDFSKGTDLEAIMHSYKTVGFQGTNLGIAFDIVNEMINWRPPQESVAEISQKTEKILKSCQEIRCTIFLGYTSNLISSGIRENILFLVRNKMV